MPLAVVHAGGAFVAVDKPAGWLSVPGRLGGEDPRPVVGRVLEEQLAQRVWPVHRLDLEVSGLIVFALSAQAHKAASQWFEGRSVRKLYQALSAGEAPGSKNPGVELWTSNLVRGKKRSFEAPHGKRAETRAQCLGSKLDRAGRAGLGWELEPLTGRSHQLRFEMARHGFPILGDGLYGAKDAWGDEGAIALRAVRLNLEGCAGREGFGLPAVLEVAGLFSGA